MVDLTSSADGFLVLTAVITVFFQLSFFAVAAGCKFDKVTDFAGATNFLAIAVLTLLLRGTFYARQVIISTCAAVWAVRLAGFLLYRILVIGEDKRFDETRNDFCKFLTFWIYQMFWVWTVSLPVTFVNGLGSNPPLGPADYAGVAMFAVGLLVEACADQQKFSFRQDPANKDHWCDVGVWKWSRHGNYFGEILLWWGVFTIASSTFRGSEAFGYFTVLSPLFTTAILLGLSGIPILEASANKRYGSRSDYRLYLKSTSVLIPFPPGCYRPLPEWLKATLLMDWKCYAVGLADMAEEQQPFDGPGPPTNP